MKLKLLVSTLMLIGVFAHAESASVANPTDQGTATAQTAPTKTDAASPESAEAAREKALDDEFSKCIPNNAKYKNRCAMLEASQTSIMHSHDIVQFAQEAQMANVYIKYLTERESSGLGYCRLKGAAQAGKAKLDPNKNMNEILELIAGCMAAQYQQVGKQENELNQILNNEKTNTVKK